MHRRLHYSNQFHGEQEVTSRLTLIALTITQNFVTLQPYRQVGVSPMHMTSHQWDYYHFFVDDLHYTDAACNYNRSIIISCII